MLLNPSKVSIPNIVIAFFVFLPFPKSLVFYLTSEISHNVLLAGSANVCWRHVVNWLTLWVSFSLFITSMAFFSSWILVILMPGDASSELRTTFSFSWITLKMRSSYSKVKLMHRVNQLPLVPFRGASGLKENLSYLFFWGGGGGGWRWEARRARGARRWYHNRVIHRPCHSSSEMGLSPMVCIA